MKPANCTGSPETCAHCAAILEMSKDPHAYARYLRRETREMFLAAGLTPPPEATEEQPEDIPNPYAAAYRPPSPAATWESTLARAAERRDALGNPANWPDYDPKGQPPDPYALAFAMKHIDEEDAAAAAAAQKEEGR